jgi:hypothetical protein
MIGQLFSSRSPLMQLAHYAVNKLDDMGLTSKALFWSDVVVVIDIAVQDSTSSFRTHFGCCLAAAIAAASAIFMHLGTKSTTL